MSSYYDIDAILAEEEVIPCSTLFPFSHMAHLDPNYFHALGQSDEVQRGRKRGVNVTTALPENSRIKMPLWSIEKWATLGFVRLSLPRYFGQKARDRIAADPASADLSRCEHFYSAGMALINLIKRCSNAVSAEVARRGRRSSTTQAALEQVLFEAEELRRTLISTYTGERLRRSFDWSLSSVDDDASAFTRRLADIELRLYRRGAAAVSAHHQWKIHGSGQIPVSSAILATQVFQIMEERVVSPDNTPEKSFEESWLRSNKRIRVK